VDENLTEVVQFFIDNGIKINGKIYGHSGWNALHILCRHNSSIKLIDTLRLLIRAGIDVNCNLKARNPQLLIRQNYKQENMEEIIALLNKRSLPM
jgi:ankyrin repeat protein